MGHRWIDDAREKLDTFRTLPKNWDSYDAEPIHGQAIECAHEVLNGLYRQHTLPPQIVPTVDGGVQLEWHDTVGHVLEIEIRYLPRID